MGSGQVNGGFLTQIPVIIKHTIEEKGRVEVEK